MPLLSLEFALTLTQTMFYAVGAAVVLVGGVLALRRYVLEAPHESSWITRGIETMLLQQDDGGYLYIVIFRIKNASHASQRLDCMRARFDFPDSTTLNDELPSVQCDEHFDGLEEQQFEESHHGASVSAGEHAQLGITGSADRIYTWAQLAWYSKSTSRSRWWPGWNRRPDYRQHLTYVMFDLNKSFVSSIPS